MVYNILKDPEDPSEDEGIYLCNGPVFNIIFKICSIITIQNIP